MKKVRDMPYPELPSVLREFVRGVRAVLSEDMVGVYLVGSLATGDFDLDSDVDFLVVTRGELTDDRVRAFEDMHVRVHGLGCYPAEHLEGSYISEDVLRDEGAVGRDTLWYVDNGSTKLERSIHDNKWHVRWILRERGVVLAGPAPSSLLDPVPLALMRAEVARDLREIAKLFAQDLRGPLSYWNSRFGQSFAVLSACRALQTLQSGTIRSKRAGVEWALRELRSEWHGLIRDAWGEREGVRHCIKIRQRANDEALEETNEFLQYVIGESKGRFAPGP